MQSRRQEPWRGRDGRQKAGTIRRPRTRMCTDAVSDVPTAHRAIETRHWPCIGVDPGHIRRAGFSKARRSRRSSHSRHTHQGDRRRQGLKDVIEAVSPSHCSTTPIDDADNIVQAAQSFLSDTSQVKRGSGKICSYADREDRGVCSVIGRSSCFGSHTGSQAHAYARAAECRATSRLPSVVRVGPVKLVKFGRLTALG